MKISTDRGLFVIFSTCKSSILTISSGMLAIPEMHSIMAGAAVSPTFFSKPVNLTKGKAVPFFLFLSKAVPDLNISALLTYHKNGKGVTSPRDHS